MSDVYDALDPETRRTLAEGRATAGAMVRAARADLRKVVVAFVLGFAGAFYALRRYGWDVLRATTESGMPPALRARVEFVAQTPFDVILLQTQVYAVVGLLVAAPVFVYASRSALKERDLWPALPDARWKLAAFAVASACLFALGVAYSHVLLFPFLFEFFARNALDSGLLPTYAVARWVHFLLMLSLVFGLAAQLPLAMGVLSYAGTVPYSRFRARWRHAVAAIVVVSASVNGSPDPVSMLIVAVPLLVLYGVGLAVSKAASAVGRGGNRLDPRDARGRSVGDREEERARRSADEGAYGDAPDDRLARAATALLGAFGGTEGDGRLRDAAAVLDALSARTLRIAVAFLGVTALAFSWLSAGGTGVLKRDFLDRLPPQVPHDAIGVVTLHPAEALVFEMKLAAFAAALATAPLVAYYAWPALRDRGLVRGRRRLVLGWSAMLAAVFVGGSALGYARVAPAVTAYLVADAVRADMILSYRITAFFWLAFVASVGVGVLAVVPALMVALNHGGVPYRAMRSRWREVSVGVLAAAAVFTPAGFSMALLATLPLMCAYAGGLAVLSVVTLRGRRDLYVYRGRA